MSTFSKVILRVNLKTKYLIQINIAISVQETFSLNFSGIEPRPRNMFDREIPTLLCFYLTLSFTALSYLILVIFCFLNSLFGFLYNLDSYIIRFFKRIRFLFCI